MSDYTCIKCGLRITDEEAYIEHRDNCNGATISMDTITRIAQGGTSASFRCDICENSQSVPDSMWRKQIIFPVCNQCKKDLRELVLTLRNKRE